MGPQGSKRPERSQRRGTSDLPTDPQGTRPAGRCLSARSVPSPRRARESHRHGASRGARSPPSCSVDPVRAAIPCPRTRSPGSLLSHATLRQACYGAAGRGQCSQLCDPLQPHFPEMRPGAWGQPPAQGRTRWGLSLLGWHPSSVRPQPPACLLGSSLDSPPEFPMFSGSFQKPHQGKQANQRRHGGNSHRDEQARQRELFLGRPRAHPGRPLCRAAGRRGRLRPPTGTAGPARPGQRLAAQASMLARAWPLSSGDPAVGRTVCGAPSAYLGSPKRLSEGCWSLCRGPRSSLTPTCTCAAPRSVSEAGCTRGWSGASWPDDHAQSLFPPSKVPWFEATSRGPTIHRSLVIHRAPTLRPTWRPPWLWEAGRAEVNVRPRPAHGRPRAARKGWPGRTPLCLPTPLCPGRVAVRGTDTVQRGRAPPKDPPAGDASPCGAVPSGSCY